MPDKIISLMKSVKAIYPELRFCQLLYLASVEGGFGHNDMFYCPDDIIVKGLKVMLKPGYKLP